MAIKAAPATWPHEEDRTTDRVEIIRQHTITKNAKERQADSAHLRFWHPTHHLRTR